MRLDLFSKTETMKRAQTNPGVKKMVTVGYESSRVYHICRKIRIQ